MKQVRCLVDDFDVTTCGVGPQPHPDVEHLELGVDFIHRRGRIGNLFDSFAREIEWFSWSLRQTPLFLETRDLLGRRRFDAVLANDVDAVGVACLLFGGERVHADLHEFFPDMGYDESKLGQRQQRYWTWMTRTVVSRAASSTTVSTTIAERYHDYGVFPGVVTNSTHLRELSARPVDGTIRIVHSGNPFHERSLGEIMRAVAASPIDVSFDLYLTFAPAKERAEFLELAGELGERITVHDPVPQSVLIETLNEYDLGIHILQPVSANNTMALPNKFFDYVQARLGIIVGPSIEMERIVREHGLGVVADGFDEGAIQRVIDGLAADAVDAFKRAADHAADELSAERQTATWVEAVGAIVGKRRLAP